MANKAGNGSSWNAGMRCRPKWDPEQKCVVEIVNASAGFLGSFNEGPLADWEKL